MSQITLLNPSRTLPTMRQHLHRMWRTNRPLTILTLLTLVTTAVTTLGIFISPVSILNEPAWLKPTKFGLSIIFYAYTLLWLTPFVQGKWRQRGARVCSWLLLLGFLPLFSLVLVQAGRGVRSHFNFATELDGIIFGTMGFFAMSIWGVTAVFALLLFTQKMAQRGLGLSIKLGLLIALIGSGLGYLMIPPTAEQQVALESGQAITTVGAHSVGVKDGGTGLPIVGWSTEGGDLRIPHFFGLHGLQLIPLLGLLLMRQKRPMDQQVRLVWIGGLGYLGLVGLLTWQALRGQSIIAPDGLMLTAFAGLVGLVGTAVYLIHNKPIVKHPLNVQRNVEM